jgi:hypothetical protein
MLPPEEAALFLSLYPHLIGLPPTVSAGSRHRCSQLRGSLDGQGQAVTLLDNIALIDAFIEEQASFVKPTWPTCPLAAFLRRFRHRERLGPVHGLSDRRTSAGLWRSGPYQ